MSFLVELPVKLYNPHAFAAFKPVAPYDLGTARALMWLSQLAYETAHPDKIAKICQLWGLAQPRTIASVPGALPLTRTRAIVVEGHGAMLMAFAGTDPLVPANWFTDFDFTVTPGAIHRGFELAAAAIWEQVLQALAARRELTVLLAGHSLGGALAAVPPTARSRTQMSAPPPCTRTECRGAVAPISPRATTTRSALRLSAWCTAMTSWRRCRRHRSASAMSGGSSPAPAPAHLPRTHSRRRTSPTIRRSCARW